MRLILALIFSLLLYPDSLKCVNFDRAKASGFNCFSEGCIYSILPSEKQLNRESFRVGQNAHIWASRGINPFLTAQPTAIPQTIEEYEAEKNLDQMLLLLQKRLAIMHEVARTKWNQNGKIEDKARETQILNDLSEQGKKRGLDVNWTGKFFQAQIEAAKQVQKNDFDTWQSQGAGKFDATLDLKTEIREYIDQINQELLDLLSTLQTKGYKKYLLQTPISNRASDYVDPQVWQMAISPLY